VFILLCYNFDYIFIHQEHSLRTTEMYVVNSGTFMYAKHGKLVDADASAPKPVKTP